MQVRQFVSLRPCKCKRVPFATCRHAFSCTCRPFLFPQASIRPGTRLPVRLTGFEWKHNQRKERSVLPERIHFSRDHPDSEAKKVRADCLSVRSDGIVGELRPVRNSDASWYHRHCRKITVKQGLSLYRLMQQGVRGTSLAEFVSHQVERIPVSTGGSAIGDRYRTVRRVTANDILARGEFDRSSQGTYAKLLM